MGKIELLVIGDTLQQVPGPFKTETGVVMQQQIGLIGAAKTMAEFYVRSRPAGMYPIFLINTQQQTGTVQGNQGCRL